MVRICKEKSFQPAPRLRHHELKMAKGKQTAQRQKMAQERPFK